MMKRNDHTEVSRPRRWGRAAEVWRVPRFRWTIIAAVVWAVLVFDWMCVPVSFFARYTIGLFAAGEGGVQLASTMLRTVMFGGAVLVALAWIVWAFRREAASLLTRAGWAQRVGRWVGDPNLTRWSGASVSRIEQYVVLSLALFPIWQFCVFAFNEAGSRTFAVLSAQLGTGTAFAAGLAWTVWGVERGSRYYERRRRERAAGVDPRGADALSAPLAMSGAAALPLPQEQVWNPIDLEAWYYGRRSPKLNQSITTIFGYALAFFILVLLFSRLGGCQEIYEMPAGGGEEKPKVQTVKIEKVIRKKFVINPFSAVVFNPPPIEEVKLNLQEITKHEYQIGQGKGTGAGFSGGTFRGKVRFIRLEYAGGDWDQDFGVGADLNMLLKYGIETGHQVHDRTESRTIAELARFPIGKSPPLVYMTGQRAINLSKREVEILREFILDKHGMIFADNGGSSQFHSQFFSMMDKVLEGTGVYPVKVPLDDVIHRIPFTLPFLPYVAPHGGKDAWGWYKDGRWLAYYHPGDIGDAWSDGHAGVRREIYEACYQLGVNVIFYAHAEYNKWLDTREKKE